MSSCFENAMDSKYICKTKKEQMKKLPLLLLSLLLFWSCTANNTSRNEQIETTAEFEISNKNLATVEQIKAYRKAIDQENSLQNTCFDWMATECGQGKICYLQNKQEIVKITLTGDFDDFSWQEHFYFEQQGLVFAQSIIERTKKGVEQKVIRESYDFYLSDDNVILLEENFAKRAYDGRLDLIRVYQIRHAYFEKSFNEIICP